MTIAPLEPADAVDDAELAVAAAGGNQLAFSAIYDRYADRLYDFCVGMLRDGDAAADCVQDVFVTAATKLVQLQDPNRLRSWLYAIARTRRWRASAWLRDDTLADTTLVQPEPGSEIANDVEPWWPPPEVDDRERSSAASLSAAQVRHLRTALIAAPVRRPPRRRPRPLRHPRRRRPAIRSSDQRLATQQFVDFRAAGVAGLHAFDDGGHRRGVVQP
jgi:DNA-directed RNA polymerase specialized sigma24 family protein